MTAPFVAARCRLPVLLAVLAQTCGTSAYSAVTAPSASSGPLPGAVPLPTWGPEPRPLQIAPPTLGDPSSRARDPSPDGTAHARAGLTDDLAQLRAALQRLRTHVERGDLAESGHAVDHALTPHDAHSSASSTSAPARRGERHGVNLTVRGTGYAARVTASVHREPLDGVLRDLAELIGCPLDTAASPDLRRLITLRVEDVPAEAVLDRLLGQIGLGWRDEPAGPGVRRIVLTQRSIPVDVAVRSARAEAAFAAASALPHDADQRRESAAAAEALWRLGRAAQDRRSNIAAIGLYGQVVDGFANAKDPDVRAMVQRSVRGIGDCLAALGSFLDARGVYRNYIARAPLASDGGSPDRDLPSVYLAAADVGRRHGELRNDPLAIDEAVDDLHALLERFGDLPAAAADVALGRLRLGELLLRAGRWKEAEAQLSRYLAAAHLTPETAEHRLAAWLSECAFQLGRTDQARHIAERLYRAWRSGQADPALDADTYARAAFRIGQCHLAGTTPQPVPALFAFLRARQDFPRSGLDAELLLSIARCYADLEREDDTMAALWELLRSDHLRDPRPGQLQLDELVGQLVARLGDYPGPVRARVLFAIAQASLHQAERDRAVRSEIASLAVGYYKRVLDEQPPTALRHAASIGRARAALLAGQDDLATTSLRDLLRDPLLTARDRELAARLLGDWYRDKGMLREAIRAFRGEVVE